MALFHARWVDEAGNAWIGRRKALAPGVLSSVYISAVALAKRGAWPLGAPRMYDIDDAHLALYAKAAKTREGFQRYLDDFVFKSR